MRTEFMVLVTAVMMMVLPLLDAIRVDFPRVWRESWLTISLINFHGQWIFDYRWCWWDHYFVYTRMWWPRGIVWSALASK